MNQSRHNFQKIQVGKVLFDKIDFQTATETIVERAKSGPGGLVITPNVAHLLQADQDPNYIDMVKKAFLVLADGMPIIWGAKWLKTPLPEKVSGSDLIYSVCKQAGESDVGVFLLGGDVNEADQAKTRLTTMYPKLHIAGTHYPEFGFDKCPQKTAEIVEKIKASGAKIIFVGVGAPKQEQWSLKVQSQLPDCVFLGVGISISMAAGNTSRAPVWMQKSGLEWIYRFSQEPRRLGLRYLKCMTFPWIVWKTKTQARA